jgi:alpha-beta hydrolase superfamily lysophospholipase
MRWLWQRCRQRPRQALALVLLALFALFNFLAYQHAHAMTHYARSGGWERQTGAGKGSPEALSPWSKARLLVCGVRMARPSSDATPAGVDLPFEAITVQGREGDLAAWLVPHEKPRGVVLIFHGFGNCKGQMLPEAQAFHEMGYACFLVDFRGCGGSAGDSTTVGYREADDVAAAVEHVRRHWPGQPVVLFGRSMGSAAILRAVGVLGVEADALLLECPFDRMLTAVRVRCRLVAGVSFPLAEALVFWGGAQHGFNAFAHNPARYARSVGCPVLLMHGAVDSRVSARDMQAIHDALPGRKALHTFAGVGHESYVNRRPAEWREQVETFLGDR